MVHGREAAWSAAFPRFRGRLQQPIVRGNAPLAVEFRADQPDVMLHCADGAVRLRVKTRDERKEPGMRSMLEKMRFAALTAFFALAGLVPAAAAKLGQPSPWEINFQPAGSPIMEFIESFHNWLLVIITAIMLFVTAMLLYCIYAFNAKRNPKPSKVTHNTALEIVWTVVPVLILVGIAIPSFRLLYDQLELPKGDITVKATGTAQWTWTYTYPDNGGFSYDSVMLQDNELKPGQPRLLAVDNELVVPVNKIVRVQVTGDGIIHSFSVPAFGIKIDAIPGRLNETWFKAEKVGIYYGQCSQLCGRNHAFMPIAVRVVSDQDFTAWLDQAKKKFSAVPGLSPDMVASAAAPARH
jgi:cytochrome c oxidase subunit 2